MNKIREKMAYWLLPPGINNLVQRLTRQRYLLMPAVRAVLARNEVFRDCHVNDKRCFILASGSSIKTQDLTLLKNEICISVSNWYVHEDYALIRPRYHCVPFIGGHRQIKSDDAIQWLRQMEERTDPAIMFFSYGDKVLIEQNGLFRNRPVYFVHSGFDTADLDRGKGLDLTQPVLSAQSVSVMALTIALFMGFKKIYLLGCDHDWILHLGTSAHFYPKSEHAILSRQGYNEWGGMDDYEADFRAYVSLWGQYKAIKRQALSKGMDIYNATAGGLLDVFPRVEYKSLF